MGMQNDQIHTLALTLAYEGAPFSGFARQPGQLTVQGSLEEALKLLYRRPVETTCAGRTDSGVHARGQVVSFDLNEEEYAQRKESTLQRSLNALVDEHIAITAVEEKPPGFSARFDAKAREYRYFLSTEPTRPVLLKDHVWHLGRSLDGEAMRAGAKHLIGEHDFKSFCKAISAEGKPTCRNISEITIATEELWGETVEVFIIKGNAFLHSMVRTVVGTLVQVGLGHQKPSWVAGVLEACDRRAAGETAPANGLVFWEVCY